MEELVEAMEKIQECIVSGKVPSDDFVVEDDPWEEDTVSLRNRKVH